ncbi:6-carboxytetrahydropterin synthase QueD [Selenomonas sp. TAMA-11512]|uniref:6-carboxytetrahydropterin synthase QueD n=1 Tax=Selenomonas sp. TAMA-11512 TaxID=3095337 RepID=UPI0030897B5B|nr:6-carboxytetrahydropterin synthase QueD [Selenomonas sp. TAMA-11512]
MYEIKVNAEFEAAHRVAGYPGKCDRLHGHSWKVEAIVRGKELDALGMLVDFKVVKGALNEILDTMDHQYLNELEAFQSVNPTAEHLAAYIYGKLKASSRDWADGKLHAIRVWESPRASVTYSEES